VDDVVRYAVAVLLAEEELARQIGSLGVLGDQITQQVRRPLGVGAGLDEQVEQLEIVLTGASGPEEHPGRRR
jgi:hypothetical protein